MKVLRSIRVTHSILFLSFASLVGAQTQSSQNGGSKDAPDAAMMAPVTALASYMAHVEDAVLPSVFVDDGLVIVEDFAPFIFSGKDVSSTVGCWFSTPCRSTQRPKIQLWPGKRL